MTCRECERILLDTKRCSEGNGGKLRLAEAHLANCFTCRKDLSSFSHVNNALALLKEVSACSEVPREIERNLLFFFHEHNSELLSAGIQRSWHFYRWAFALVLIVAVFVGYQAMRAKSLGAMGAMGAVKQNLPPAPSATPPHTKRLAAKALSSRKPVTKRPNTAFQPGYAVAANKGNERHENLDMREVMPQPDPIREDVVATSSDPTSGGEGGTVVRVTVPASSLQMIGWSVVPEAANRRVTADIVVDPYGVVQRVNLIEPSPVKK